MTLLSSSAFVNRLNELDLFLSWKRELREVRWLVDGRHSAVLPKQLEKLSTSWASALSRSAGVAWWTLSSTDCSACAGGEYVVPVHRRHAMPSSRRALSKREGTAARPKIEQNILFNSYWDLPAQSVSARNFIPQQWNWFRKFWAFYSTDFSIFEVSASGLDLKN